MAVFMVRMYDSIALGFIKLWLKVKFREGDICNPYNKVKGVYWIRFFRSCIYLSVDINCPENILNTIQQICMASPFTIYSKNKIYGKIIEISPISKRYLFTWERYLFSRKRYLFTLLNKKRYLFKLKRYLFFQKLKRYLSYLRRYLSLL
jgi:hypothetical protein